MHGILILIVFYTFHSLAHGQTLPTQNFPEYKNYEIGEWTIGKPAIRDWQRCKLHIGRFCTISEKVIIIIGGEHGTNLITTYPFYALWRDYQFWSSETKGDIIIDNDVWIGYGTHILSGVHIGNGSVILPMSLVTKDIPPYTVAGGIPAKPLRQRIPSHLIDKMIKIAWWDWPEEKIKEALPYIMSL